MVIKAQWILLQCHLSVKDFACTVLKKERKKERKKNKSHRIRQDVIDLPERYVKLTKSALCMHDNLVYALEITQRVRSYTAWLPVNEKCKLVQPYNGLPVRSWRRKAGDVKGLNPAATVPSRSSSANSHRPAHSNKQEGQNAHTIHFHNLKYTKQQTRGAKCSHNSHSQP